ncbi:MAG: DUF58 domain-containing protein [Armatimonadota bacterium]|jgi:uncharacterized protein (DUF58 family)
MAPTDRLDPTGLAQLESMELRARTIVDGLFSGQHRSRFRGASAEFADHREYSPGDETRHINWKVFGRTDRLFLKQYDADTNLHVHLLLDASASMGQAADGLTKLEYASYLAAALAYVAVSQGDAAGLIVFDEGVRSRVAPAAARAHLGALLEQLDEVQASGQTNVSETLHALAAQIRRRGIVVILSDLYGDAALTLRSLAHFRHHGHDVAVFHVLDPVELDFAFRGPVLFRDVETAETLAADADTLRASYRAELAAFVRTYQQGCRDKYIDYIQVDTRTAVGQVLTDFLQRRLSATR